MSYRVCYITETQRGGSKPPCETLEAANQIVRGMRLVYGYKDVKVGKHYERITRVWVEKD